MSWLPDGWMIKARTDPHARWHIIEIRPPARTRSVFGESVRTDCGIKLDYDASTMNVRLEMAGLNRATPGERCLRCHWPA